MPMYEFEFDLPEELLANNLHALLHRKILQRMQMGRLYQAYPRAVVWKGQKACHSDYASLKSLLIIPVVHVLNVNLDNLGLDSKSTADRNSPFFLFGGLLFSKGS